jgi:ubiquinone/menaquinone biosynthesis C-methylase UbiE
MAGLRDEAAAAGRMWGGADYERVAQKFAPIHDDLVRRLEPAAGERWLDVATGTGEVALRAARAGVDVTAVDISEGLLELARAKPGAERVRWELGDAQDLRFDDGAFDVVVSCFGVIFAPDTEGTASELARVCRSGGRLGLTAWRPEDGPHAIYNQFMPGAAHSIADEWGKEATVEKLLDGAFELRIDEGVWRLTAESPEAAWELMTEGAPPLKALLASLEAEQTKEFRQAMLERWAEFQTGEGVVEPRRFLIITGSRR